MVPRAESRRSLIWEEAHGQEAGSHDDGRRPVGDNQNSIVAAPCGLDLPHDDRMIEKLAHEYHERLPERVVQQHFVGNNLLKS
jgi:catalase